MRAIAKSAHNLYAEEGKYILRYVFACVATMNSGLNLGGSGGHSSNAWVFLPSSSSGDFLTFKFVTKSEKLAAQFLRNKELIQTFSLLYGTTQVRPTASILMDNNLDMLEALRWTIT